MKKMTRSQTRQHYLSVFPKLNVDRFTLSCPDCGVGRNSEPAGGGELCFHCDTCGLVECEVTSPALEDLNFMKNDSISE
jgi:hypothetical protein